MDEITTTSADAEGEPGTTLASTVYGKLRYDILCGSLAPGEKLRAEYLRDRYEVGNSPVREALNRLSADGLVVREDQKGFRVSSVSRTELHELTQTRCWLEGLALREAIANGQDEWEEALVLACHRLSKVRQSSDETTYVVNPDWEALHREFHMALISACGSRFLIDFCGQLNDKAGRYRLLAVKTVFPRRDEVGEHAAIVAACIGRDADQAVRLLHEHFGHTERIILATKSDVFDDT